MSRKKISVIIAEFLGTAFLTSIILAQANSNVIVNRTWFNAAVAGLTLATLVLTIGRVSGAHVNPAITIGLWTLRKIETTTAIVYIAAQLLGAAVALRLFQYMQNDVLQNIAGTFEWRIFVAEAVGTLIFSFGVAAAVTQKLQGLRAAFTIGTSLMLGAIFAAVASNGILNPALSLGVNSWSWTYVAAPIMGSVLGMNIYDLFFAPESELQAQSAQFMESKKSAKKSSKKIKK